MFKHILVPTDGSELSMSAVRQAAAFAGALGARITFFHATPRYPTGIYRHAATFEPITEKQYAELADNRAQKVLGEAERVAKAAGVSCTSCAEIGDSPYEGILRAAEREHCDLICMASHGQRGIGALLLGSETQKVLTHSKVPVLVCR